ncbi:UNKNOWN [Stylonychia lemnae]|uniref:Uncharacterized protein n=1 Tax=Stylonychia lemnae TaxID=5949 RepID=A0A078B2R1_STYLE|nr:UNKNOWN [Stylonychia lemnae]|eukprot:CDW87788.1 UNKNOWN [Stylonychia lemnae]
MKLKDLETSIDKSLQKTKNQQNYITEKDLELKDHKYLYDDIIGFLSETEYQQVVAEKAQILQEQVQILSEKFDLEDERQQDREVLEDAELIQLGLIDDDFETLLDQNFIEEKIELIEQFRQKIHEQIATKSTLQSIQLQTILAKKLKEKQAESRVRLDNIANSQAVILQKEIDKTVSEINHESSLAILKSKEIIETICQNSNNKKLVEQIKKQLIKYQTKIDQSSEDRIEIEKQQNEQTQRFDQELAKIQSEVNQEEDLNRNLKNQVLQYQQNLQEIKLEQEVLLDENQELKETIQDEREYSQLIQENAEEQDTNLKTENLKPKKPFKFYSNIIQDIQSESRQILIQQ